MAQASSLILTLKQQLKVRGKTYADVAKHLALSEASVKRMFAEENFTVVRLEDICQMLGLEFSELVLLMTNKRNTVVKLTYEQEQHIVSDSLLLLLTVCVTNGYSYEDITDHYQLDPEECQSKLNLLHRLNIIDLLPGNRIKLRISANFSWLPNGPIQHFFQKSVEKEFFNVNFDNSTEKLIVLNGFLTETGNGNIQKKMQQLANDFHQLCQQEKSQPLAQRQGTSLVVAVRQWQYTLFDRYRKPKG